MQASEKARPRIEVSASIDEVEITSCGKIEDAFMVRRKITKEK